MTASISVCVVTGYIGKDKSAFARASGNVSHIECRGYGNFICRQNDGTHLIAVDLPVELMVEAMSDLRLMNITAATLFPGIDGICKMIKHDMLLQNLKAQGHGKKLKPPSQVAVEEPL